MPDSTWSTGTPVRPKILIVNHFGLGTICGTSVMFDQLLRLAPEAVPDVLFAYESYQSHRSPTELCARLEVAHSDVLCIIAVNAHIEVSWNFSEGLFGWSLARQIPAYVYAHDYWPHHKDNLRALKTCFGARLLASTPFVAEGLLRDGFSSQVIDVGVPLPDVWPAERTPASPKVIASVGRLVPRKRLPDIVRAFANSGLDGLARLYLRVLPSQVFSSVSDGEQLREIEAEVKWARLSNVVLDCQPGEPPDYSAYSAYVCSSSYEGFSMTVIESAFHGCPPLMSDIPPHQRTARVLFGDEAVEFLFPVGDHRALAALLHDEITTGRRRTLLAARIGEVRASITERFSLARTAREMGALAER